MSWSHKCPQLIHSCKQSPEGHSSAARYPGVLLYLIIICFLKTLILLIYMFVFSCLFLSNVATWIIASPYNSREYYDLATFRNIWYALWLSRVHDQKQLLNQVIFTFKMAAIGGDTPPRGFYACCWRGYTTSRILLALFVPVTHTCYSLIGGWLDLGYYLTGQKINSNWIWQATNCWKILWSKVYE